MVNWLLFIHQFSNIFDGASTKSQATLVQVHSVEFVQSQEKTHKYEELTWFHETERIGFDSINYEKRVPFHGKMSPRPHDG